MHRRTRQLLVVAPLSIAAAFLAGNARARDAAATPQSAVEIGWRLQDLTRSQDLLRESIRGLGAQIANSPEGDQTRRFHWVRADGVRAEAEMTGEQARRKRADLEAELAELAATRRRLERERAEALRLRAANAARLADVLTARPPADGDDPI